MVTSLQQRKWRKPLTCGWTTSWKTFFALSTLIAPLLSAPVRADDAADIRYLQARNEVLEEEVVRLRQELDALKPKPKKEHDESSVLDQLGKDSWVDNINGRTLGKAVGAVGKGVMAPVRATGFAVSATMNDLNAKQQRDAEYREWLKYNHPDLYVFERQSDKNRRYLEQRNIMDGFKPARPIYVLPPYERY